jgi:hypothetical protein
VSLLDHRFEAAAPEISDSAKPLWPSVLGGWMLASAVLLVTCASAIAHQLYPDPDDIMRLLQVRDLLGGQSWWDVNQHRLASGLMHWSRLVDLPIAAVELLARPLIGTALAERVALAVVPLITLGTVMALGASLTRRLLDDERARYALLVAPLSVPLVYQMRPMRIDHHGWQVTLAMAALLALIGRADGRPGARSGAIAGLCLATLLTISLEGLPVAAALLGIVALGWVIDPERRPQLVGATGVAFAAAVLLHLVTRGPHFWTPACDAMAPVWLAVLGVAAIGSAGVSHLPIDGAGRGSMALRLVALALVGAASGAALLLVDARCTAGPFQMLDPLVRTMWYERVSEGMPVWRQAPIWAAMCAGLPIVGLVGSALAIHNAAGSRRTAWLVATGALAAAFALSLLVSRSAATANAFALPGAALVLTALLTRARAIRPVAPRTLATAGALLTAAPGLAAMTVLGPPEDRVTTEIHANLARLGHPACASPDDDRALAQLPAATLFAPIDIAPDIIAATDHHAITSGHHRNAAAMRDVLRAFTGSPEQARTLVAHYRADYVIGCPGMNETELYDETAPDGFWARLERGERFDWLTPVPIPGSRILAWRVRHLPEAPPAL